MENIDPFVINFIVFTLAIFVGYFVVWAVTSLHTPLMSVTNAISGIIVGSLTLIILSPENNDFQKIFRFIIINGLSSHCFGKYKCWGLCSYTKNVSNV